MIRTAPPVGRRSGRRSLFLLGSLMTAGALAQTPTLQSALDDYLRTQTQGLPGKVSYQISPLDANAQLTPCSVFEPFLPSGTRLWGRATVGVRCLGPASWTIYVPVQISVQGHYLVTARTLSAGQRIGPPDYVVRNGDLGRLPASVVSEPAQALGKTLKNGLAAGQPLRNDQLTAPWVVQQGQSVRTVSQGPGFSVSSEGRALNNASEGQVVQVRTPNGQTLSGIARAGGIVEIAH